VRESTGKSSLTILANYLKPHELAKAERAAMRQLRREEREINKLLKLVSKSPADPAEVERMKREQREVTRLLDLIAASA
jgi:hypothetical protein